MKLQIFAAALTAFVVVSPACFASPQASQLAPSDVLKEVAIQQYTVDAANAPVHSRRDLDQYLRANPSSPLFKMSPPARNRFISKLVFTSRGVGSFSYLELENLSVTDVYNILSIFGQQKMLRAVPGLMATNKVEQSMLLLAPSVQTLGGITNYYCLVPIRTPYNPPSVCEYEYGSTCNDKCGGG